jgi:prevent-host-death family protein
MKNHSLFSVADRAFSGKIKRRKPNMTIVRDYGGLLMATTAEPKGSTIGNVKTIAAGEFKAKCLKLLDQVAQTREPLIVTKHGVPVAKLVPLPPRGDLFGAMKGTVLWEGDSISPIEGVWDLDERTDELVKKLK